MGLTSSLYAGLSGLGANSQLINVSGNNIANANTIGFKSSRIGFETQISQLLSMGSAPSGSMGGTNPIQIGMGVRNGSTTRDFSTGTIQPTGVNTDIAIEGAGFFAVKFPNNTYYTRAGNFTLDSNFNLVYKGGNVQGYGVDSTFKVVEGNLTNLNIPLGSLTLSEATRNIRLGGNLNAGGEVSTAGSIIATEQLHSAAGSASGSNLATGSTLLSSVYDTMGTTALFTQGTTTVAGDVITISGVSKGGATLPTHTFEVNSSNVAGADAYGTTVQDFMNFLQEILGLDTSVGGAGVALSSNGELTITGNTGLKNDLVFETANIVKNKTTSPVQPFSTMAKSQTASGESVRTSFVAYDSLGNQMTIDMTVTLEAKTSAGTQWRFYTQSEDNAGLARAMGNGTLNFDNNGRLVSVTGGSFNIDRSGTGAASPQTITLQFSNDQSSISALTDVSSQIASQFQDGSPIGTLQDFSVDTDGTIIGVFSNSLLRPLGQLVLANFTNPQGLVEGNQNLLSPSSNSGSPQLFAPGQGGTGKTIGSAQELSNVELSQEFINLITASTGFSASSRVLTTSDRLLQELLSTLR